MQTQPNQSLQQSLQRVVISKQPSKKYNYPNFNRVLYIILIYNVKMSTIDKCCQTVKEFHSVLNEIKLERQKIQQKQEKNSKGLSEIDRKKVLKLFNYDKWSEYMKWIDEKLYESGEDLESFMDVSRTVSESSSQIRFNRDNEDQDTTKKQAKYEDNESFSIENESQYDLLSKENKKLTRHNNQLKKQYEQIIRKYTQIMK